MVDFVNNVRSFVNYAIFCELCDRMRSEVNCAKSHHPVISEGRDVQGITTLIGRRLGKTLTIKLRVWDLAMFTNDTQDKKDTRR